MSVGPRYGGRMPLFDHLGITVDELDRAAEQFGPVLAALGMEREQGEGLGGWISNIVNRARGGGGEGSEAGSGRYKRVEQDDDDR